jgi:hypothetical protein
MALVVLGVLLLVIVALAAASIHASERAYNRIQWYAAQRGELRRGSSSSPTFLS